MWWSPKKDQKKNSQDVAVNEFVTAACPINTGIHPAIPPQTIFCEVWRLSAIVYPKT